MLRLNNGGRRSVGAVNERIRFIFPGVKKIYSSRWMKAEFLTIFMLFLKGSYPLDLRSKRYLQ